MPRQVINARYELDELPLAKGGMGEVWGGRDTRLDREVAVKFVRIPAGEDDDDLLRRFLRESKITAALQHPGVPAVYDVGTHRGRPYLVMQRVRGITVADLIAEHERLSVAWSATIAAQVCSVLTLAHRASLIHRDLKPANLILEPEGTIKVLDFGLAVALDSTVFSRITHTGQTLGTPAYMAPEQVQAGISGPATDLYAVGCLLFEMLTGRQVFTGETAYSVMNQQADRAPTPVRELREDTPADIEALIAELLHKQPEQRPSDAGTVYRRLLPHTTDLRFLPGILHPPTLPNAVGMYAAVVAQIPTSTRTPAPTENAEPVMSEHQMHSPTVADADVDRARRTAAELAAQSRYGEAAETLKAVLPAAQGDTGLGSAEIAAIRHQLADVTFDGGDFRTAATEYEQLVEYSAADIDADTLLHVRLRAATCHALQGKISQALTELGSLLPDQQARYGPDDDRVLELRRQIGLLRLGAGDRAGAQRTLQGLLTDLIRLRRSDTPEAGRVRDLLTNLDRPPG
ncbi:serine/threonine-protein kinase [Actinocatenispora sera]|uniref:serine/threonine-protein kinase n=1 Tax=Actinocatenispora sera TaxID=390989 RepID=UPI0033E38C78